MGDIKRAGGGAKGRSSGTAYNGTVWAVATAPDKRLPMYEQTQGTLAAIDKYLAELGTDKTRLLSATVYITEMLAKGDMDRAWNEWIGPDAAHWPQRACVCVVLEGPALVEVVVTAAAKS